MKRRNGSYEVFSEQRLVKIRNVPCEDGTKRTIYVQGRYSPHLLAVKGATRIKGKHVDGFAMLSESGWDFYTNRSTK